MQRHIRFLPGSAEQGCDLTSSTTKTICHVFSLGPCFPSQQIHESLGVVAQLTPETLHHLFILRDWRRNNKWEIPEGKNCKSPTAWLVPCGTAHAETKCLESDTSWVHVLDLYGVITGERRSLGLNKNIRELLPSYTSFCRLKKWETSQFYYGTSLLGSERSYLEKWLMDKLKIIK